MKLCFYFSSIIFSCIFYSDINAQENSVKKETINTFNDFESVLEHSKTIQYLELNLLNETEFLLCKKNKVDFSAFSNLQGLELYTEVLDSVYVEKLLVSLSKLPHFEKIEIKSHWSHSFTGLSNVKSLQLMGNMDLNNPGLLNFVAVEKLAIGYESNRSVNIESPIFKLPHLKTIALYGFSDDMFPYEKLSDIESLESLFIERCIMKRIPVELSLVDGLSYISLIDTKILSDTLNLEWMCKDSKVPDQKYCDFHFSMEEDLALNVPYLSDKVVYTVPGKIYLHFDISKGDKNNIQKAKRLRRKFKCVNRKSNKRKSFGGYRQLILNIE